MSSYVHPTDAGTEIYKRYYGDHNTPLLWLPQHTVANEYYIASTGTSIRREGEGRANVETNETYMYY